MASYQIKCSIQTGCRSGGHITGVRIGTSEYTVAQIYSFMRNGDTFYTIGPRSGLRAEVEPLDCACGAGSLRTVGDRTKDNNLDSLVC